ncbi:MAG: hypothetical protein ACRDMA_09695 [Solirubrobacterales bacterium]
MKIRLQHLAAAGAVAVVGLATFAATGFGGQSDGPDAEVTVVDDVRMKTVRTERLSAGEAAARGLATASAKIKVGIQAKYRTAAADVPVSPNAGVVVPIDCPGKSLAVSGGMQNNFIALVENSSSHSTTAAGAPPADWYEGVTNTNTGGAPLGFRPTLVCVKLKR